MNVLACIYCFILGGFVSTCILYIWVNHIIKDCYRRTEEVEIAFVKFVAESKGYTIDSSDTADDWCE